MVARARRWTRGVLVRLAGVEADDAGMSTAEYATVRLCTLGTRPVYQAEDVSAGHRDESLRLPVTSPLG